MASTSDSNERPERLSLGLAAAALTLVAWTSGPLFIRFFADHLDPWTSNALRYCGAALIWLPLLLLAVVRKRVSKKLWTAAIPPAIANVLGQICFAKAFYHVGPTTVTIGLRVQFVAAAIGAAIFFLAERKLIRTPAFIAGAAVTIAGVMMVALNSAGAAESSPFPNAALGFTLAVLGGIGYAAYPLAVRICMAQVNPMLAFALISQYSALSLLALMFIFSDQPLTSIANLESRLYPVLLASMVIPIALGHVLYYVGLKHAGVATTASIIQLQPFCVALGAYPLFGERLNTLQWIGGSIAVAGTFVILYARRRMAMRQVSPASDER